MKRILVGVLLVVLWTAPAWADTHAAPSCAQAAVQDTITNVAHTGDTVTVPQGNCTWYSAVTISGKRLTLQGAGIGQTNITDGVGGALYVTASATNFVDVNGFTFIKQATNGLGIVQFSGTYGEVAFRFHHNRLFDNGVSGGRGFYAVNVFGLIDNCVFDMTAASGSNQMVSIDGTPIGNDQGFTPWTEPLALGSSKAVYIELCTFTYAQQSEDAIDAYSGARMVVRHNTFNNVTQGYHGTDSGNNRSPVNVEVYANVFHNDSGNSIYATNNRGGTGVYFDNSYEGTTSWHGLWLTYYRAFYNIATGNFGNWNYCNGTAYDLQGVPPADAAHHTTTYGSGGVRFLASNPDVLCTGAVAGDCTRGLDGGGTYGYPCRDQPGRGPAGQTLAPVYQWNNGSVSFYVNLTSCGDPSPLCNTQPQPWIQANRDYYDYVPSGFDGKVGVGRGLLAARPASCQGNAGYFATNVGINGTLYQCVAGTWTAYYTPLAYPHPLTDTSSPAAPSAISIPATASPRLQWTHDGAKTLRFEVVIDGGTPIDLRVPPVDGTVRSVPLSAIGTLTGGSHSVVLRACNGIGCTAAAAMTVVKLMP